MIERIRGCFSTETRAANSDYTAQMIAASLAAARGLDGVRGSGAYQSCVNLISASASIAELEGQHSEALQKHLGQIARGLTDCGESIWLIDADGEGRMMLLPATVANVTGSASPESWNYSLTQPGPSQTVTLYRPGAAVLHFRANVNQKVPWRGRAALEASNTTGALLAALECQMASESRMKPTRMMSIGKSDTQRLVVEGAIEAGGIVAVSGASAGDKSPAGALEAGKIRSEITAPQVNLHEGLTRQICAALGVPADLLLGGSEAGSRESFRRFAASTISSLLEIVRIEWAAKVAPIDVSLDTLRAGDISARSRALGTRAAAVGRLVTAGVEVERAMRVAGLAETP